MNSGNDEIQIHEHLLRWIWLQGWEKLREIQINAFAPVSSADRDVIICAPTAGGKTEAAYFPIFTKLLNESNQLPGFSVLNISPLKALINDQFRRLDELLNGSHINVIPWHGDISQTKKKKSENIRDGVLLITPESLESMFANRPHMAEKLFKNLQYVVIDEFHAFLGEERGMQLISLLSRLEHMAKRRIPRIAISATLADRRQAADFLRPRREDYPVSFPDHGNAGHDVRLLIKEFIPSSEQDNYLFATASDIFNNLRGSNNLVFVNSRKEAESLGITLKDIAEEKGVPNEFFVHHGSLSKTQREGVEKSLKAGNHPLTAICTSTLELGIDIGRMKSIAQIGVANSVSALRQRLGRSGRRGEPSILRIYSMDERRNDYKYFLRTNLVQNIAVVELLKEGRYEIPDTNALHLSTLIQQILSLLGQFGSFYVKDAWQLLCANGAFQNISPDIFLELMKALGKAELITQTGSGQIVIAQQGERLMKRHDFYAAFKVKDDINVLDKASGLIVGTIQYMPYPGEYIMLAAKRWIVESVDVRSGHVIVNRAQTSGKLMFEGYGAEVSELITRKMRDVYLSDEIYPYLDSRTGSNMELTHARSAFRELGLHCNNFIKLDNEQVWFSWAGAKINRTIALMIAIAKGKMPNYDPYSIENFTRQDIPLLLNNPKITKQALANRMPDYKKEIGKYDSFLSDDLLNLQYATSAIDLHAALHTLQNL